MRSPVIVAFVILYSRLASIASVEHIDNDLYKISIKQDYYFDEVLNANISKPEDLADFINHKTFFGLTDSLVENVDFGCSSFLAQTPDGDFIAGRNYDYAEAGELALYTNPSDGFASIGMTEFGALGLNGELGIEPDSLLGKTVMMFAPYATMDGVNEKGVMVSILQLTPGATHPRTEKPDITITVAIRLILDRAESVDHAIELLQQYDVHGEGEYAHHLFISDSSGNAAVVEWPGSQMKVVKDQPAVTNFFLSNRSKVFYCGSCDRYDKIVDWLSHHSTTTSEQAMDVLKSVSQSGGEYPTQWSAVYNLNDFCMDVTIDRNYDKVYHFTTKDFN